jgi:hypothetical protein
MRVDQKTQAYAWALDYSIFSELCPLPLEALYLPV